MKHTGLNRYRRHRAAGALGTTVADDTTLAVLPRSAAWPLVRPLYSAMVIAGSIGVLCVYAVAALVKAPFVVYEQRHATIVTGLSRAVLLAGVQFRVTYDPEFDPQRATVFCQNHVSVLDGPLAAAVIPQPFCGLMNHWHFRVPGYGWLMQLGRSIRVYPRSSGRTEEITAEARSRAEEGLSILVFPEGHRTLDGNVRAFRRGVLFMARDAGIPIAPVLVRGLYDVNHKGQLTFRPGAVEVYVGRQMEIDHLDDAGVTDLADRLTRFADTWVKDGRADRELLR